MLFKPTCLYLFKHTKPIHNYCGIMTLHIAKTHIIFDITKLIRKSRLLELKQYVSSTWVTDCFPRYVNTSFWMVDTLGVSLGRLTDIVLLQHGTIKNDNSSDAITRQSIIVYSLRRCTRES